jgi:hypothetical protein
MLSMEGPIVAEVHRDALSAWRALCTAGGIEIADRDEELPELLRTRLAPGDCPLEDALATTSTDYLIAAFFDVIHPFVDMFRAILAFFERAGATEGVSNGASESTVSHLISSTSGNFFVAGIPLTVSPRSRPSTFGELGSR